MSASLSQGSRVALRLGKVLRGHAFGVRQPIFLASLKVSLKEKVDWEKVDNVIGQIGHISIQKHPSNQDDSIQLALRALDFSYKLQVSSGVPLFEHGRISGWRDGEFEEKTIGLIVPYAPGCAAPGFELLQKACHIIDRLALADCSERLVELLKVDLEKIRSHFTSLAPRGTNMLRFIRGAHNEQIPWSSIFGPYYQFGWGSRQCTLDSTILDTTSSIGVSIARNKFICAKVLRQAGLPVPDHLMVKNIDEALGASRKIGYPLVVKPSNLDGGVGVSAGLRDDEQLISAYRNASRHSKSVLIESHQSGEDFRVIVLDGRMVWAIGRQPAAVTGDGVSTVEDLVHKVNADPCRGYHADATLRPIKLDQEALDLLSQQELRLDAIPVRGRFVRLRRSANISSGGTPILLTNRVHPDNKSLAERAVNIVGLDIAGVDLILPDITKSWRETGGAIIEINAQPQLVASSQSHLYCDILNARIAHHGRIPVVIALGGGNAKQLMSEVFEQLHHEGVRAGLVCANETLLPDKTLANRKLSIFDGGQAILKQKDADALLIVVDDMSILATGLPVDKFDTLLMIGSEMMDGQEPPFWLPQALSMLTPHCTMNFLSDSPSLAQWAQGCGVPKGISTLISENLRHLRMAVVRSVLGASK